MDKLWWISRPSEWVFLLMVTAMVYMAWAAIVDILTVFQ